MSDQSESSPFQSLFDCALRGYEKQTGIGLANHPLAEQLQNCQSVESVITLLQEQARASQALSKSRESDKIFNSLKGVVSALSSISVTAAFGQAIGMSFPFAHAIHTGLGILLIAFKEITAHLDDLVDLLESIEHFLNRLYIYTKVPPTPAMTEIVAKIMVELLSTLALATKQIRQGRPKKFVKKFFGENEVDAILQRLDRLTQDEARTTAAQILEVVYGLVQNMRLVVGDEKASADSVRDALEMIQQMASEMNKSKRYKLLEDVRSWLSPPDPWKIHNLVLGSRHTGTAAWFVQGSTLTDWKSSGPSSLIWIHGKPGAGKSVLCSTIIENINSMRKYGLALLAFFYFDFRERDLRGLLSSVLVQLCHQSDSYYQILSGFYSEHENGSHYPSDDELQQCLKNILGVPGQAPVYLIIDGLDECPNTSAMPSPREKVLMLLEDLIDSRFPNLRVCITSRPENDIKVALKPLTFRSVSLHDESGQLEDIDNYIRSIINKDPKMRRWKAADKELAVEVLIRKSDGRFRWVYFQIVYLRRRLPGSIQIALDDLPETLDETYERALLDIDKANWEFASRIFQCVAVAFRPLRVTELAEILSFDFKAGPIPKFHKNWRLEDPFYAVQSTTSGLLTIVDVDDSQVVQFSHVSVKEYLTSDRFAETNDTISRRYHISMTPAHTVAAKACLGILLHLDKDVVRDSLYEYPLAEYAAEHWVNHARFEGVSRNVEDGMKRLFDPNEHHLAIWVWIYDPVKEPWERAEMPLQPRGSPLHYAALCGLDAIVEFLILQYSQDVNSLGFEDECGPLHLASEEGYSKVARLLLEHGADVTAQTNCWWTPLHLASRWGNEDVARLLLKHGADMTAKDKNGWNSLHVALSWRQAELVRILIEHGAGEITQGKDKWTPSHREPLREYIDVAQILFYHGTDVTAHGLTPLHLAAGGHVKLALILNHSAAAAAHGWTPVDTAWSMEHVELTRVLLESGANATSQDKNDASPFHWASSRGDAEIARILFEHGADANARDNDNCTPLHWASQQGHWELVHVLIEHGVDADARDNDDRTPLHWASHQGHSDVVHVLAEHGVDADARDNNNCTPLHWASQQGNLEVVRILVKHGIDVNARDHSNWTPLHVASQNGHQEVVRILVKHGIDVNARDHSNWTPLHVASQTGHQEVVQLLLEYGANAHASDQGGWTSLQWPSYNGYLEIVRMLLEHGVDATTRDNSNWTPLHGASQLGHREVVQVLLEHGADANSCDDNNQTALHLASRAGHFELVQLLVESGANIHVRNNEGRTPLEEASVKGHRDIMELLLRYGDKEDGV